MQYPEKLDLVIGLAFGSESKGAICGHLSMREDYDTVCLQYSMNAGHTFLHPDGYRYVHMAFPNGVFSPSLKRILWGPGSVLNMDVWERERASLVERVPGFSSVRLLIHPNAAIILQRHVDEEAGPMTKIGSTKKGVGAAMIERIRRNPDHNNFAHNVLRGTPFEQYVAKTPEEFNREMDCAKRVLVESCQGYSLSLYHGFTPYTTSRDITTAQVFADCAIPWRWSHVANVVGVYRTYPIRVANRYDESGSQVGCSGPCYDDQSEVSWENLGLVPELTTVTKLPRRVFTFSEKQLSEAIRQCGVDELFLNFMNYLPSVMDVSNILSKSVKVASENGAVLRYVGVGPNPNQILDLTNMSDFLKLATAAAQFPNQHGVRV